MEIASGLRDYILYQFFNVQYIVLFIGRWFERLALSLWRSALTPTFAYRIKIGDSKLQYPIRDS